MKILRWRDYPALFRWAQCNYRGLYKRKARESKAGKRDAVMEAEVKVIRFEDREEGHKPRNVGGLYKLKKRRKWILL